MAVPYPLSPARLLAQVEQLEEMELPSLPCIQHDNPDFESGIITEAESSLDDSDHSDATHMPPPVIATPHPLRKSFLPPSASSHSSGISSETSIGSPYPPPMEHSQTPSPYAPTTALTSTPQTLPSRTSSEGTRDEPRPWQTPGELSRSFSGQEIQVDGWEQGDKGENLATVGSPMNERSSTDDLGQKSFSRRLSTSNVVFGRRGKRTTLDPRQQPTAIMEAKLLAPAPSISQTSSSLDAPSTPSPFDNQTQARVPSLSRSEMSASDPSEAASTPEGPSRDPKIATPRETRAGSLVSPAPRRLEWNDYLHSQDDFTPDHSEDDTERSESINQMALPSLGSLIPADISSPNKDNPKRDRSTPGLARLNSRDRQQSVQAPNYRIGTPFSDITPNQNTPMQFPSTSVLDGTPSKQSDFSTPRAPLDDIARRKSHVLAVLSSGGLPARVYKTVRGTPHPLRRVSTAQQYETTQEESSVESSSLGVPVHKEDVPQIKADSSHVTGDNESFVSIASSADLTSDRRATSYKQGLSRGNTSFPTILLPTSNLHSSPGNIIRGPLGEQRADGIKIHKHLNAMNKQLLDTNAELAREAEAWREEVQRLMRCLHNAGVQVEDVDIAAKIGARPRSFDESSASIPNGTSSSFIRKSASQTPELTTSLSEEATVDSRSEVSQRPVAQSLSSDSEAEDRPTRFSDSEQAAMLEEMAERLEVLERGLDEKDELIAELEEQLAGTRADDVPSDSDADKERADLRRALETAEEARISLQTEFAQKTEQHAREFANICAEFESQVSSLESRLAEANDTISAMQLEIAEGRTVPSSNDGGKHGTESLRDLAKAQADLHAARNEIDSLRALLEAKESEKQEVVMRAQAMEAESLRPAESGTSTATADAPDHVISNSVRETEISHLQQTNQELRKEVSEREIELRNLSESIERLESELDVTASERHKAVHELNTEVDRLNGLLSDSNEVIAQREAELETLRARQSESESFELGNDDKKAIELMESHLEDAFREIGRLKHQLAAGPHLQSTLDAREARIESLEREKAALQDRLSATREATPALPIASSPFRATPFVNKAIASLRLPNTPGPLQELSWLHTTVGDANEPLLRAQIDKLQTDLIDANGQLDSNFSRLEAAGLNGVRLAEELATAQARIQELEDELIALAQRDKASQALLSERKSQERQGDDRIKRALEGVHKQMDDLQSEHHAERSRILRENKRLTAVVSEIRRDHSMDLQAVKADADRVLASKDSEIRRLKGDLLTVQRQMDSQKKEIEQTAAELKEAEKRLDSQRLQYDRLARGQKETTSVSLDEHRRLVHQLRESLQSCEEKASELARNNQTVEASLKIAEERISRLQAERASTADELMAFERDLRNQQKESQRFGIELQKLKVDQQSKAARHALQLATSERELRIAQERVKIVERELLQAQKAQASILSQQASNLPGLLEDQRAKYQLQAKDLAIQIRYLKAKFTRESTFRNALSLQKRYLLLLVGGMSLSEQATLKQIAAMGYPVPEPPRRRHTLKAVGMAVLSLIRARNSAAEWRRQRMEKSEAVAARAARKRILTQ